jgi:HEAT repeat protein
MRRHARNTLSSVKLYVGRSCFSRTTARIRSGITRQQTSFRGACKDQQVPRDRALAIAALAPIRRATCTERLVAASLFRGPRREGLGSLAAFVIRALLVGAFLMCFWFGTCPAHEPPEPDVEELFASLTSADPAEVRRADEVISTVRWGTPTIPFLISRLTDERLSRFPYPYQMRPLGEHAAECLVNIGGPAVPPLAEKVARSGHTEARIRAIKALADIGPDAGEAIPALLTCARDADADEWVRYFAIDATIKIMRNPCEVIPTLLHCLDDPSPELQGAAIRGLGVIGPNAQKALPRLLEMLSSQEFRRVDRFSFVPVRADVAVTIGRIGSRDRAVIERLKALMSDEEPRVQIAAAHAYCRLAKDAGPGLTVLTEHLRRSSRSDVIPFAAAKALGELGTRARPAAGELVRALRHDKRLVRAAAVDAIAAVVPGEYLELILPMLEDDSFLVRSAIINRIGKDDAHNVRMINVLIRALDDRDSMVRDVALNVIEDMGPNAEKAIPRLEVMAACDQPWERDRAREVLKRIQDEAPTHRRRESNDGESMFQKE